MTEQVETSKAKTKANMRGNDGGGFIWVLGTIGAAVYYIQHAESFGQGALGVLKAFVWPAILVYKLLQSWGM